MLANRASSRPERQAEVSAREYVSNANPIGTLKHIVRGSGLGVDDFR